MLNRPVSGLSIQAAHTYRYCMYILIPSHRQHCTNFCVTTLDGTRRHHLLPQVVLVVPNGAVPSADGLVLAYHDVLRNLIKQPDFRQHQSKEGIFRLPT